MSGMPSDAGGVEAEQVGDGLRDEGDAQRLVEDDDRVDAALHERAERGLAALQGAGQPALPVPEHGLRPDQDGETGQRDEHARGAGTASTPTTTAATTTRERRNDEQPGAPAAGRDRERSRWLPQDGGGGHMDCDRVPRQCCCSNVTELSPVGGIASGCHRLRGPGVPASLRRGGCGSQPISGRRQTEVWRGSPPPIFSPT